MKRTSIHPKPESADASRATGDNLCKRLAEEHPEQFARWLFGAGGKVKVEKTELSREPIRADSVIFSRGEDEMLHTEFQTSTKSDVPLPLRLLDYYVGLKRQNPNRRVRQALVVLKPTSEPIPDHYRDERTVHGYDVIVMSEQDPAELLKHEGLLPLATLCRAESGEQLLGEVAARIKQIISPERRRETLNWSRVLAGLRYDTSLIYQMLKESDMLEESVVYQDIIQKGEQRGLQQGVEKGERKLALHLLEHRLGKLSQTARQQIEQLAIERLEALSEALFDFQSKQDLTRWLKQHAPKRRSEV